jgi:hypothetical protein
MPANDCTIWRSAMMLPMNRASRLLPGYPACRTGSAFGAASPARAQQGAAERSGAHLRRIRRCNLFVPKAALRVSVPVCPEPWLGQRYTIVPLCPPESAPIVTHLVAQRPWQSGRGPPVGGPRAEIRTV